MTRRALIDLHLFHNLLSWVAYRFELLATLRELIYYYYNCWDSKQWMTKLSFKNPWINFKAQKANDNDHNNHSVATIPRPFRLDIYHLQVVWTSDSHVRGPKFPIIVGVALNRYVEFQYRRKLHETVFDDPTHAPHNQFSWGVRIHRPVSIFSRCDPSLSFVTFLPTSSILLRKGDGLIRSGLGYLCYVREAI